MSSVFTEDWQGGANGVTCTTANTNFASLVDNRWSFSTTQLLPGTSSTMSGRCNVAAQTGIASANSAWTAAATSFMRFYMYIVTLPASNISLATVRNATTLLGELRLQSAGAIAIRNSNAVAIATSGNGTIPTGQWCRLEWTYNNTAAQQRLKIFSTSAHGTTADYDSGAVTTLATGSPNGLQFGFINSATAEGYFDYLEVDNATMPGPVGTAASYKKEQFLPFF